MTATTDSATRRRGVAGWVAIGVALVLLGVLGAGVATIGQWSQRSALDPESAGPTGTRALVEILRDKGVQVQIVHDRGAAASALEREPATLVLPDTPALSDEGVKRLTDLARDVVLIDPRARTLELLLPGSGPAGIAGDMAVPPACTFEVAERAGAIAPAAVYDTGDSTGCYPADGGYGLLTTARGDGRVSAVDGAALFTNEVLAENGNAALALGLTGSLPLVVWYQPTDTDLANANPTLGELTPTWLTPVIVVLLAAGIAAAVWRGRRFGPLVEERLPVTVRAAETDEGRGRLYAHSRDAAHAAEQLRARARARIAHDLGLSTTLPADAVCDAAAAITGLDRNSVHRVLQGAPPRDDADLVNLATGIRHLESAVRAAVRPEGNPR